MSIRNRRRAFLLGIALVAGVLALAATGASSASKGPDPVARGRYLVSVLGCNDCHTPWKMGEKGPEPDMSRMLSGHPQDVKLRPAPALKDGWGYAGSQTNTAFSGPWGVSYAMNLTPDKLSGIGIWTEDMFTRAIRLGKHWGQSRRVMPPMPWQVYRNLTDEDLHAVWSYLRTIPPIRNRPPDYLPPEEQD
ncbi:MAG TPA: diheme cytochrome c-553 [Planctomycetota bacterium]|nr:diheme cytochrome c-553 [Planctomycetota bacterium]